MTKLNQLAVPDETKLGFVFIITYILIDATTSWHLSGATLLFALGLKWNPVAAAAIQLVLVFFFATAYLLFREFIVHRRLQVQPLSEVDANLEAVAAELRQALSARNAKVLITSNFADSNAFCFWSVRTGITVIIGAGLRLLSRKQPKRAKAVLAHELSHVHNGDTLYLLFTWSVLIGYGATALLSIAVEHLALVLWPTRLLAWATSPTDISYLEAYPRFLASTLLPPLSVAALYATLVYFTRLREFLADERTAQLGLRSDLAALLAEASGASPTQRYRALLRTHPPRLERAERVATLEKWSRLDVLFIACAGFVSARFLDKSEHFSDAMQSSAPQLVNSADFSSSIEHMLEYWNWADTLGATFLLLSGALVTANIYRVSATQVVDGRSFSFRLSTLLPCIGAVCAGSFLGLMTSWDVLYRLLSPRVDWNFGAAFDFALYRSSVNAMLVALFGLGVIAAAPYAMGKWPRPVGVQLVRLVLVGLVFVFLAQSLFGLALLLLDELGVKAPDWYTPWLPDSSRPQFGDGMSVIQILLSVVLTLLSLHIVTRTSQVIQRKAKQRWQRWHVAA